MIKSGDVAEDAMRRLGITAKVRASNFPLQKSLTSPPGFMVVPSRPKDAAPVEGEGRANIHSMSLLSFVTSSKA